MKWLLWLSLLLPIGCSNVHVGPTTIGGAYDLKEHEPASLYIQQQFTYGNP